MVYENLCGWRLRKTNPIKPNFETLPGAIRLGSLFLADRGKGLIKDFMDFFRKTAGYDIDLRRKIA